MHESAESKEDFPPETSISAASLESILCTEELRRRPSRPPDYEKENRALVALVSALADSPHTILQILAETIMEVTQCDSSGLSLLTREDGGKRFYWPAIAGIWQPYIGGGTPRYFGPCGDVLDRNIPLLFRHFERRYPYLLPVMPPAEECLLVPFYVAGKAVGTIWAIMHDDHRKFDAEDERLLLSLGKFASSAYQTVVSIDDLNFQIAARHKAETALRELANGLEAKIRRLVGANILGMFICKSDGEITEANEAFLKMVRYSREDLTSGRMRWKDLRPPEWRGRDELEQADLMATGSVQPYEKEFFRRDGSRVPVLIGSALFEEGGDEVVAFVLDLSEQKHAEDALRLLLNLNNRVVSNLDLHQLFRALATELRRIMEFDFVGLALPENGGKHLREYALEYSQGKGPRCEGMLIPIEASCSGVAFRRAKPFVFQSVEQARCAPEICAGAEEAVYEMATAEGFKSGCFLPLISHKRVLGVLQLTKHEENAFDREEIDFLSQVASQVTIAVDNALNYQQVTESRARLTEEKLYLEQEIKQQNNFEEIVGSSPALLQLLQRVALIAPTDSSVLICGETGTGKELIARAIHARSSRKDRPLVKVNCGSIPTGLVESELFGHVKGAFTGATANRTGRFEVANGGTLFLDEVGELPLDTQVKLLRVLQEQEFEPVGSSRPIRVDVRMIAASNRDLEEAVRSGLFRSDLYYRLNVLPLRVAPLRERRSDIPEIALYFLSRFSKRTGKRFEGVSPETMELLTKYSWPGNIRELQNIIERGVVLSQGPVFSLGPDLFPFERSHPIPLTSRDSGNKDQSSKTRAFSEEAPSFRPASLEESERSQILAVLGQTKGQINGPKGAAAVLKINPNTLRGRMKKLGIMRLPHHIS